LFLLAAAPGALGEDRVVRFVRRRGNVHLVSLRFAISARDAPRLQQAVKAAQLPTVPMSLDILAESAGGDPVVDLTPLFGARRPKASGRLHEAARHAEHGPRAVSHRPREGIPAEFRVVLGKPGRARPAQPMEQSIGNPGMPGMAHPERARRRTRENSFSRPLSSSGPTA
jgi:hypothetical protein